MNGSVFYFFKYMVIGAALILGCVGCGPSKTDQAPTLQDQHQATAASPDTQSKVIQPETKVKTSWQYGESKDSMRGTTDKYAVLTSSNVLNFSFPYNGGTSAELVIFSDKSRGYVIQLSVGKGQFLQKQMYLKFDDSKVIEVTKFGDTTVREDGSPNSVTIAMGRPKEFVKKLSDAKHLTIEAMFYQDGSQQIEFETANLDLSKIKI